MPPGTMMESWLVPPGSRGTHLHTWPGSRDLLPHMSLVWAASGDMLISGNCAELAPHLAWALWDSWLQRLKVKPTFSLPSPMHDSGKLSLELAYHPESTVKVALVGCCR